jgi:hypothetical protein
MDLETARKVRETLEGVNESIFGLLPFLEARCSKDEFEILKREIARVSNGIDLNLYPLILKQYPQLDPLKDVDSK